MKLHVVMLCMQHFLQGIATAAKVRTATGSMGCARHQTVCHPGLMLNSNQYMGPHSLGVEVLAQNF